jgi:hypothetical protein
MKNFKITLDESAKYFCEKRTSFNGRATTQLRFVINEMESKARKEESKKN